MELKTRDKIIVVVLVIVALAVFFGGRYRDNHTHFTTEKWVSAVGNDRQGGHSLRWACTARRRE